MLRRGGTGSDLPMSMADVEGSGGGLGATSSLYGNSRGTFKGNQFGLARLILPQASVKKAAVGIAVATFVLLFLVGDGKYLLTAVSICLCGLLFGNHLSSYVLSADDGDEAMRRVSDPIREGAEGFLKVQYGAIRKFAAVVAFMIFLSYQFRPYDGSGHGIGSVNPWVMGFVGSVSFLLGCTCSAFAGYVSMWVSARANIRVASAARRSYVEALLLCFRGGAFSAVLVISMCVLGVSLLHMVLSMMFVGEPGTPGAISAAEVPLLLAGYGFGASFVALFMQLGGGVYTKAADVGADLVGKVERGIPEDDPRNPAVIADLVGDMVGDCVGSSADIFESVAAEIIGAMILGGVLAQEAGLEHGTSFVFFPVIIHAFDVAVSSVAILSVGRGGEGEPMAMLMRGYLVSLVLAGVGFVFATWWLLGTDKYPGAWLHFLGCGVVGMCTAYVFIRSSQYYTDYAYEPVQSIAKASTTGHGTNIITGVAVGMKSTFIPVIAVSIAVVASYHLGRTSGMGSGHNAGLFGTAVATMGMLSSAAFVLSMNNYGPIADNAGGIAEMSQQQPAVREATDRLDAAGNVTKAMTKGYSIGSAALACFLLFGALLDEFTDFAGRPFKSVDLAVPEVMVGGMLGVMMVFFFVGLSVEAVGITAGKVVEEVRRQFDACPEIMAGTRLPDYRACVSLVTEAALRQMRLPGALAVGMPVFVGIVFRVVGDFTERPLLGAEVLCAFLMMATVTGILMALFLDNVGGAWDNAKKFIELGNYGGKNSEAHKAAVTGDTVGDPFKDTAGPSLHVVIKLLSTTILVLGPAFVSHQAANAAELAS